MAKIRLQVGDLSDPARVAQALYDQIVALHRAQAQARGRGRTEPARKYNADQPRWPAGTPVDPETGAGGGRFRPTGDDGAGAGEGADSLSNLAGLYDLVARGDVSRDDFLGILSGLDRDAISEYADEILSSMEAFGDLREFLEAIDGDALEALVDYRWASRLAQTIPDKELFEEFFGDPIDVFLMNDDPDFLQQALDNGWITGDDYVEQMIRQGHEDELDLTQIDWYGPIRVDGELTYPVSSLLKDDGFDTYTYIVNMGDWKISAGVHIWDKDGNTGEVEYTLDYSQRDAHLDLIIMPDSDRYHGLGRRVLDTLLDLARDQGMETASLEADITIGRYAWAKMGFDYADPDGARQATTKFRQWATERGIEEPPGGWPEFGSAYEVATYDIPGVVLHGRDLMPPPGDVEWVPDDMPLHVGKAFMLDRGYYGHGNWYGKMRL